MVLADNRTLHGTMIYIYIFTKGSPGTKSPYSRDTDVNDLKTDVSWDEDKCMGQSERQEML